MINRIATYYKNLPVSISKIALSVLAICLFFILKEYTNHIINRYNYEFSWVLTSLKIGVNYIFWGLFTPIAYWLSKLVQQRKTITLKKVFQFILGCIALVLLHQLASTRVYALLNYADSGYLNQFFAENNLVLLTLGTFSGLIELLLIIGIFIGFEYQQKYLEKQKELITAQLNTLRMQLHPHFLFNTLHSIASMIDIDTKDAQKMLTKIGSLLRVMLENDAEQIIPLQEEVAFIKNYLDLEEIRFQDRVTITYQIDEEVLNAQIPNMILQPLIENAVNHGIAKTIAAGNIRIKAIKTIDSKLKIPCLEFQISNTLGNRSSTRKKIGFGVGLKNVQQRLERVYPNQYIFKTQIKNDTQFIATIIIPFNQ
ncbi:MAG: histidine kinase [Flavobacteriaceae bacterium]|nr:histidine kinase [Flavobacteriaceae bacterium]